MLNIDLGCVIAFFQLSSGNMGQFRAAGNGKLFVSLRKKRPSLFSERGH